MSYLYNIIKTIETEPGVMKNNFNVKSNLKMEGEKIWAKLPRENLTNWLCLSRFSKPQKSDFESCGPKS